jgi:hypothetical protein
MQHPAVVSALEQKDAFVRSVRDAIAPALQEDSMSDDAKAPPPPPPPAPPPGARKNASVRATATGRRRRTKRGRSTASGRPWGRRTTARRWRSGCGPWPSWTR